MTEMPELTKKQVKNAISGRVHQRLMRGKFESKEDIVALRKFIGMSQSEFAYALNIKIATLQGWEQGRREPEGPAVALLTIAACHPRIIHQNLKKARLNAA